MLGDESADFVFRRLRAGCERYDRAGLFAEHPVRNRNERGVDNSGMLIKNVLDLDTIYVLATADQHVLGAINDITETFIIEPRDIAGPQPAVVHKSLGG